MVDGFRRVMGVMVVWMIDGCLMADRTKISKNND
jgi:hypothetical protein